MATTHSCLAVDQLFDYCIADPFMVAKVPVLPSAAAGFRMSQHIYLYGCSAHDIIGAHPFDFVCSCCLVLLCCVAPISLSNAFFFILYVVLVDQIEMYEYLQ